MNTCRNNPEISSTTKVNKHTPSGYSLFTCFSFDTRKNMLDYYRGKDCMKKFCLNLKGQATKIVKYENVSQAKKNAVYAKKDVVLMITIESIIK